MANISMALETAEDCGVKVTCSAQDVHDMNTKLVLGFIWSLITKFQTGGDAAALRARLEHHAGVPVANITTAFSDGTLLLRMIDRKKKGIINVDTLDPSKAHENCGNALYLLETKFQMPHVLDASDLSIEGGLDEKAALTFWPYVIDALEGNVGGPSAHDDHAPSVFNRTAAPAPTRAPAQSASAVVRTPVAQSSGPSYGQAPSPSRAVSSGSFKGPSAARGPAPPAVNASARAPAPHVAAGQPKRNYSRAVSSLFPGLPFNAINVDGRTALGTSPCQQCNGELGNGRCFEFNHGGKVNHVHSRCFDCSVCRKDFTTGVVYVSPEGKLFCVSHFMENQGVICKACTEPITDFFISALESKWHEDCFSCTKCAVPFVEPKFFDQGGMPYCADCHAEVNGRSCARCGKGAPNALKAMDKLWHDNCFTCGTCNGVISGAFVEADGLPHHGDCLTGGGGARPAAQARTSPRGSASSPERHGYGSGGTTGGSRALAAAANAPAVKTAARPVSPTQDYYAPRVPVASDALPPCGSCHADIPGGEAVTVSGKRYHKTCFVCCKCREPIKSQFFSIPDGFCCPKCEKELPVEAAGGDNSPCHKCGKLLVGAVVQALGKEYHKDCFGCAVCGKKFPGNSFYTFNGKAVCEDHAQG